MSLSIQYRNLTFVTQGWALLRHCWADL